MVDKYQFIRLLERYGLDANKLIENNINVLEYAKYLNAEKIIIYLQSIGISNKNIEKCPSILSWTTDSTIKSNYEFLTQEIEFTHQEIENTLSIVNIEHNELKNMCYEILKKQKKELIGSSLWLRTYKEVQEILNLEYWQEKVYQNLLTPTIWKNC